MISIIFASVIALEALISLFWNRDEPLHTRIGTWGICFLHGTKDLFRNYIFSTFIGIYMVVFFIKFVDHETHMQSRMTPWIHPQKSHAYSFTENTNNPLPGVDVFSDISKQMRSNSFTWPKEHIDYAIRLNGTLPFSGPNKSPLLCSTESKTSNASTSPTPEVNYACYASKLALFKPSDENIWGSSPKIVPMPSQFYYTDVMIIPPQGTLCKNLEVYRIILNSIGDVDSGLDFPSSSLATHPTSTNLYQHCNLFGKSNWCLHSHHTFAYNDYSKRMEELCTRGGGSLEFRLPVRSLDIDPLTGKSSLDALIVTRGALVKLKFSWSHSTAENSDMYTFNSKNEFNSWSSWHTSDDDLAQSWRTSNDTFAVFLKFAIVSIPLFMVWYFLTVQFFSLFSSKENTQIIILCVFILLPSILLFLSVGAWLPMTGSIICGLVINHAPSHLQHTSSHKAWWNVYLRPSLFFLTAVCNSIQFIWILILSSQAGWNAFFYDFSLKQLSDISSNFIVSGTVSTNWISLILPCLLLVNLSFILGSCICIVLEVLEYWNHRNGNK
jgi:hypothetical protein